MISKKHEIEQEVARFYRVSDEKFRKRRAHYVEYYFDRAPADGKARTERKLKGLLFCREAIETPPVSMAAKVSYFLAVESVMREPLIVEWICANAAPEGIDYINTLRDLADHDEDPRYFDGAIVAAEAILFREEVFTHLKCTS